MASMNEVQLGKTYRDTITGFCGIATSKTQYLYGCERVGLQPTELKDGKRIEADYFDIFQLEEVSIAPPVVTHQPAKTGGPNPVPPQREVPRRD